jgi:mannosyltransferase OCH1-like enzyme
MNQTIHQVFLQFKEGKELNDIPVFKSQVNKTKHYCSKYHINYKLWREDDCNKLIMKYPQYKQLYDNFREEIQRVDFIRYLILYDEGGIYIDCDVCPIGDVYTLFEMNEFFVRWHDDKRKLPYNAVIGSAAGNPLYLDVFKEVIKSVIEKDKIDVYKKWKGRYVFQTTGHYMLQRVLKKYPHVKRLDILKIHTKGGIDVISDVCPIFEDWNASIWYNDSPNNLLSSQKVLA